MSDFQEIFVNWAEQSLSQTMPDDVIAFAFNLYEGPFAVELIGSSKFDRENEDWACEERFVSSPRKLLIPHEFAGDDWQSCLEKMCELARHLLRQSNQTANTLNAAQGVAVGFVDGDLILVTP